jgi:hypothetical protein
LRDQAFLWPDLDSAWLVVGPDSRQTCVSVNHFVAKTLFEPGPAMPAMICS